jgi:hypothetical protein
VAPMGDVLGATQVQVRRLAATAIAAVLLLTTLLAGWHEATVIHARCADHGELIDVAAGERSLGEHRIAAHDGAPAGEHDHCTLCPRAHDGAPPAIAFIPAVAPAVAPVAVVTPRDADILSVRTLRIAPKTSPPDRARSPA